MGENPGEGRAGLHDGRYPLAEMRWIDIRIHTIIITIIIIMVIDTDKPLILQGSSWPG